MIKKNSNTPSKHMFDTLKYSKIVKDQKLFCFIIYCKAHFAARCTNFTNLYKEFFLLFISYLSTNSMIKSGTYIRQQIKLCETIANYCDWRWTCRFILNNGNKKQLKKKKWILTSKSSFEVSLESSLKIILST